MMSDRRLASKQNEGVEPEGQAKADQGAFGFTPSQAATSYAPSTYTSNTRSQYHPAIDQDDDMDGDNQTRVTSYTYASQADAQRFLKRVDNRAFNALSDAYFLPTDGEEWARLNKQHIAIVLALNSPYISQDEVRALLAPGTGNKKILDLGCGSGVWAHDLAQEFPHADVLGIDLAPTPVDNVQFGPNCRFEIDDVNLGMQHHHSSFDLIHARFIVGGIKDFKKTMKDVHKCLKPGGMVMWLDADYDLHGSTEFNYLPLAEGEDPMIGSRCHRMIYETRRAAMRLGKSDFKGMSRAMDEGLWDDELMDPETCKTATLYLPAGPWANSRDIHESQRLKFIGSLIRQDFMSAHRAAHPLLKKAGWPEDLMKKWSDEVDEELMANRNQVSFKLKLAWGRRRAAPNEPAPPLPQVINSNLDDDGEEKPSLQPFPFLFVYNTKEESLRAAEENDRRKEEVLKGREPEGPPAVDTPAPAPAPLASDGPSTPAPTTSN